MAKFVDAGRRQGTEATLGDSSGRLHKHRAIDDLDVALVERLRIDGRESSRSLATSLEVNEATVGNRLRRMEDAGIMRVVAVTDVRAFGHRELAFAFVDAAGGSVHAVATALASLPESVAVTICTGRCDIIVALLARGRSHLSELFGSALAQIEGIGRIRGSLALEILKFESRWAVLDANTGSAPQVQANENIDEVDLEIIRMLQLNARRSNRDIAAQIGMSEGTVRTRIRRMLADRVLRIQAVSDAGAFGIGAHSFIGITAAAGRVDEVGTDLVRRGDIAQLTRVIGEYDLIGLLVARDHTALVDTMLNEISTISGIRTIEKFDTFATLKHAHTWTWLDLGRGPAESSRARVRRTI